MFYLTNLYVSMLIVGVVFATSLELKFEHHDNTELIQFLKTVNQSYPDLTYLYTIGQSSAGEDIWVIAIGSNVSTYKPLRPHVKYIANIHGNEAVGRELLLHLIKLIVEGYSTNSTIQQYLDSTVVHIMPTMNPDGYEMAVLGRCLGLSGRVNREGLDLNRNFPDLWHDRGLKPIGVETQAVMDWLSKYNFILSASFHGGAMVVNYPYDQYMDLTRLHGYGPNLCPDDDTFRFLSLTYSRSHRNMALNEGTECRDDYFEDGITNGVNWFSVPGGMQDYNYLKHGIFEMRIELSCCKYPQATELEHFWIDNKDALINLLMEAQRGVKGFVLDSKNNIIVGAELAIKGRESVPFHSGHHGEYYRILMPGTYTVKATFEGHTAVSKTFTVREGEVTILDLILESETTNGSLRLACLSYLSLIASIVSIMMHDWYR